eukprot:gene3793-4546_t
MALPDPPAGPGLSPAGPVNPAGPERACLLRAVALRLCRWESKAYRAARDRDRAERWEQGRQKPGAAAAAAAGPGAAEAAAASSEEESSDSGDASDGGSSTDVYSTSDSDQ